jgi:hypothetical protein
MGVGGATTLTLDELLTALTCINPFVNLTAAAKSCHLQSTLRAQAVNMPFFKRPAEFLLQMQQLH